MRTLVLAARNLLRHKLKTLVVLSALIVGLTGLVVFQGFLSEMMKGWRDNTILSGIGHFQVAGSNSYFVDGEFNPYAYPFPQASTVAKKLSGKPGVLAVIPSVGFVAMVGFKDESSTLLVKGYPADRMVFAPKLGVFHAPKDRFFLGTLETGSPPSRLTRGEIYLGSTSARILGAHVGDKVTLMTVLPGGQLTGQDFKVAGTFESPGQDDLEAYTDFASASKFTGLVQPAVLDVLLEGVNKVDTVTSTLPPGVAFRTWKKLATLYVQVNSMLLSFLGVIRAVLLIVTLFILANAMNRVVLERMREWGTLRALGTKKRGILALVLTEGALMGFVGSVLGIALGFGVAAVINLAGGFTYTQGPLTWVIRDRPGLDAVLVNVVPATLVAGLAAVFPGFRAIRLTPSECLKEI